MGTISGTTWVSPIKFIDNIGAGDGNRTRDVQLGNCFGNPMVTGFRGFPLRTEAQNSAKTRTFRTLSAPGS